MLSDFSDILPEKPRPLKRTEYDQLVNLGAFEGEKIELLKGVLVEMSPQGTEHSEVIRKLNHLLVTLMNGRATVGVQVPLGASDESEPEPDFSVVRLGEYLDDHPRTALLVIEVAVSSLRKDRGPKAEIYAAALVPEYWIIDVPKRRVIVHRQPRDGAYTQVTTHGEAETLTLVAFADMKIAIRDALPTVR